MSYNAEYIRAAMPHIFEYDETPAKETAIDPSMPKAQSDPRKANDSHIGMIDVRRAWNHCEWLTHDERQAILGIALTGTAEIASRFTGVPRQTLSDRERNGLEMMAHWLSTTVAERAQLEEDTRRAVRDAIRGYAPAPSRP